MGKKPAKQYDIDLVRSAAAGRWPEILAALGGVDRSILDGKHHPCPKCGGTDRFRMIDEAAGACHCNQCFTTKNGDGFASLSWLTGKDFGHSLRVIADYLNISPSTNGSHKSNGKQNHDPAEHLALTDWTDGEESLVTMFFLPRKPGITIGAIKAIGGRPGMYRGQHKVIAIPVYGPKLDDADPVGWHLYPTTKATLPTWIGGKDGKVEYVKSKLTRGSQPGIIGQIDRLKSLADIPHDPNNPNGAIQMKSTIWKCEGPSDVLTLIAKIQESEAENERNDEVSNGSDIGSGDNAGDLRGRIFDPLSPAQIVLTNANGSTERPAKFTWLFERLAGHSVNVIHDADQPGQVGAATWATAFATLAGETRNVQLPYAIEPTHGNDLRDWLTTGGNSFAGLLDLAAAAAIIEPTAAAESNDKPRGDKPEILVDTEEHRVAREAIAALSTDVSIFQRSGYLTWIIRASNSATDFKRPEGSPQIATMPTPIVREKMAENIAWAVNKETKDGWEKIPVHPPGWAVNAIANRGWWPGIRFLDSVVESPVFRPDGTILAEPGYDQSTSLYYEPTCDFPAIPNEPTRDDARAAVDLLLGAVCDFPFEDSTYKSAWLASVLTPFARPAYSGPTPLFLIEANQPGSGKGLLCNVISQITMGRQFTCTPYSQDDDEMRKKITAAAISADRMILLDNVSGSIGGPSLDAALTSDTWSDRLLGKSERIKDVPLKAIWYATANNVALKGDIARRVCKIRLQSQTDRPEARRGFRHENLTEWVNLNRGELVKACLTILRAYWLAGKPKADVDPWGSFYGWSDAVRQPLIWLGLDDPGAKRAELMSSGNLEVANERQMLVELQKITYSQATSMTCNQILAYLQDDAKQQHPQFTSVSELISELCRSKKSHGLPSQISLGIKFSKIRDRIYEGGISLKSFLVGNTFHYWVVLGELRGVKGSCSPYLTRERENVNIPSPLNTPLLHENASSAHTPPNSPQLPQAENCQHEPIEFQTSDNWIRTECKFCGMILARDKKPQGANSQTSDLGF